MRSLLASKRRSRGAALILVAVLAGGCSANALETGMLVGGTTAAVLNGALDNTGHLIAYLSDGRVLEGTWMIVPNERFARDVRIEAAHEDISAVDLSAPEVPAISGRLNGAGLRMICAFVGDPQSGYRARCADDAGGRWEGMVDGVHPPLQPAGVSVFRGLAAVKLRAER